MCCRPSRLPVLNQGRGVVAARPRDKSQQAEDRVHARGPARQDEPEVFQKAIPFNPQPSCRVTSLALSLKFPWLLTVSRMRFFYTTLRLLFSDRV